MCFPSTLLVRLRYCVERARLSAVCPAVMDPGCPKTRLSMHESVPGNCPSDARHRFPGWLECNFHRALSLCICEPFVLKRPTFATANNHTNNCTHVWQPLWSTTTLSLHLLLPRATRQVCHAAGFLVQQHTQCCRENSSVFLRPTASAGRQPFLRATLSPVRLARAAHALQPPSEARALG